jgi:membrane-bound acyltransferase YfiQ involved in biofilm formation
MRLVSYSIAVLALGFALGLQTHIVLYRLLRLVEARLLMAAALVVGLCACFYLASLIGGSAAETEEES